MEKSRKLNFEIAKKELAMQIDVNNEDSKSDEGSYGIDEDLLHPYYKSKLSLTPSAKLNKEKCKIPAAIEEFLKSSQSNLIAPDRESYVLILSSDEGIDKRELGARDKKKRVMKLSKIICSSSCIIG